MTDLAPKNIKKTIDPAMVTIVRDSLTEARAAARSYDTKAQILGIGYIFALGVIGRIGDQIAAISSIDTMAVAIAWVLVVLPIAMFGYVLHPSRKSIVKKRDNTPSNVTMLLYVNDEMPLEFDAFMNAFNTADPLAELAHEFLEVSKHRDLKKTRFVNALYAALICFVSLFTIQLMQSYGI